MTFITLQVGLGIKPGTSVEDIVPYLELIDTALIMTVEPGFGGQKFMHDMMAKVSSTLTDEVSAVLKYDLVDCCTYSSRYLRCANTLMMMYTSLQVRQLRKLSRDLDIEVDGGVGPATIQECAEVTKF